MQKKSTFLNFSFVVIIATILFIVLFIGAIRYLIISSAENRAELAAQIVKESLTAHMIGGSSDYQEKFLKRLESIDGMKQSWVVRSDSISRQYGNGIYSQAPKDEIDQSVLREGKAITHVSGGIFTNSIYRYSLPYIGTSEGKIDCLSCHKATSGETLGVVSVEIEINDIKILGLIALFTLSLAFGIFIIYLLKKIYRFTKPYKESLNAIATTMKHAEVGEYESRVTPNECEEGYEAAMWTNALMEKLDHVVRQCVEKMKTLIQLERTNTDPLYVLQSSIDQLYEIERFRSAIEKDDTIEEVYGRIIALLRTRWSVQDFNLLEFNPRNKESHLIHSEKILLCDALSGCRADRLVRSADSRSYDLACPKMIDPNAHYVCRNYPIVDELDIVVSLVARDEKELTKYKSALDQLEHYINASRLQIINKKLQHNVRIDALTQLYNRTSLEDLSQLINAQSKRTLIPYGVLMVDVDQFSLVNRSYDLYVGDEVLKSVARNIQESLQSGDLLIRYGMDTFAVILYDYEMGAISEITDSIHATFKRKIRVNTYAILKTVSIGVAYFPSQSTDMLGAVELAKRALLEAKHLGGNCTVTYNKETMPLDAL